MIQQLLCGSFVSSPASSILPISSLNSQITNSISVQTRASSATHHEEQGQSGRHPQHIHLMLNHRILACTEKYRLLKLLRLKTNKYTRGKIVRVRQRDKIKELSFFSFPPNWQTANAHQVCFASEALHKTDQRKS